MPVMPGIDLRCGSPQKLGYGICAAAVRFDLALFPVPAQRTGRAHFTHRLWEKGSASPRPSHAHQGDVTSIV